MRRDVVTAAPAACATRRAKGDGYTLQAFHDAFVRQGALPLKLMRRILLPAGTSSAL
jgi:hypothetical protein